MELPTIYCKEVDIYTNVEDFLIQFYDINVNNSTYNIEDDSLQCRKDRYRSLTDLLELCKYHVDTKVSLTDLIKALNNISSEGAYYKQTNSYKEDKPVYTLTKIYGGFLFCPEVKQVVFSPTWQDLNLFEEYGIVDHESSYGLAGYNGDKRGSGSVSLTEIKQILEGKDVELSVENKVTPVEHGVNQGQDIMAQIESSGLNHYRTGANPGGRFANWYTEQEARVYADLSDSLISRRFSWEINR